MPLLSTKLSIPPPRLALVPRPHLVSRLNQGMTRLLTVISAPAGSGKTTLVSEWHRSVEKKIPLTCLSLDPEDNHLSRFLTYLVAALRTLKPDLPEVAPGLLPLGEPTPLQVMLTNLINDLGGLSEHAGLVLDDYHLITTEAVHWVVAFLVDHLPPQLHLVLITRTDPPLPLARLRARDQLVEISTLDLKFTPAEAEAFLSRSMGLELSQDEVAVLAQRTEGWVAGLQLAALAMQNPRSVEEEISGRSSWINAFAHRFSGSHLYVADYLSEEVIDRQTKPVQDFLLKTSILDGLTAELCDHLMERSDSQQMLRQLDQANLFLVPMDDHRSWYRYHHLFVDLLRSRLRETALHELPGLHDRAAKWYEQHGFVSEAIKHARSAGNWQMAAQIVENNAMARLLSGDSVTVLAWVDAVAPLLQERPWLGIYQSWARIITGEIDLIEPSLKMTERWIEINPSNLTAQEMGYHIDAIRVLAAERNNQPQLGISLARKLLARLPEHETFIRGIVTFTLGDTCWSIGDLPAAMSAFTEASRMARTAGNNFAGPLALTSIGLLLAESGELHRAAETFQSVIRSTAQPGYQNRPVGAVAYLGWAGVAYEWNHLDAAGQALEQALGLGARWGNPDTLANAHLLQARLQWAVGETTAALEALRQAEELTSGPGVTPWSSLRIHAFRVRLWLAQGNLDAAERWVQQNAVSPQDGITYTNQTAYLVKARVLEAQNRLEAALSLTERLLAHFEESGQVGRMLEVYLLQSLIHESQGNVSSALDVLARAITLGETAGYLRVYLDEDERMSELLRRAASHGIAPKTIVRLLSEFDLGTQPAQPLIEPLSKRELEVLHLIADGYSNQAIADRLVVALGTVKTHTASLYRKLGVTSRTQAVARAGELGML